MNEAKTYKVRIFDEDYSLLSDESKEHLIQSAALVDSCMREISQGASISDIKKVAVLAALRMASQVIRLEGTVNSYSRKETNLVAEIDSVFSQNQDKTY